MSFQIQKILTKVTQILTAIETATGMTITPKTLSAANDTVEAGYFEATTLSAVDADLATANIKAGVTIFGKAGKTEVVDTVEAAVPVVAGEMKTGQVGFVNGVKVTGNGTKTLSAANTNVAAGYYAETTLPAVDTDLAVANIKKGVTIFGLEGSHVTPITGDAVVGDVLAGKLFYKDDAEDQLEGTMPTVVVDPVTGAYPAGYHAGEAGGMAAVETDLLIGNIKAGATIFGLAGKTEVVDTTEATDGAAAGDIALGKFAWVNGVRIEGTHV